MAPGRRYVFAETPEISVPFTAGRHECLPYSVFQTFSKQTYKLPICAFELPGYSFFFQRPLHYLKGNPRYESDIPD